DLEAQRSAHGDLVRAAAFLKGAFYALVQPVVRRKLPGGDKFLEPGSKLARRVHHPFYQKFKPLGSKQARLARDARKSTVSGAVLCKPLAHDARQLPMPASTYSHAAMFGSGAQVN